MGVLELLESMASRSAEMVTAARQNDWPLLVELEHSLALDRSRLESLEADGRETLRMTAAERLRKAELIQRILADGQEVLSHVLPHQESLRRLLSISSVGRNLRQAYALGS